MSEATRQKVSTNETEHRRTADIAYQNKDITSKFLALSEDIVLFAPGYSKADEERLRKEIML